MFGIDDAIIAAGVSSIGSLAGGLISSGGQQWVNSASQQYALQNMRENNSFNADQARINRDFQERMSNTAYQRAMQDMRQAGLNPILAYQQGGSSTPGGAQGSATQPQGAQFENVMDSVGHGVTSAAKGAQAALDMKNVMAQTNATTTQAGLNQANQNLSVVNAAKAAQDTATSAADMRRKDAETALTVEQMDNPKAYRALTQAQGASAYANAGLSNEQAKQLREYGPHWTGQAAGSVERVINRLRGLGSVPKMSDVPHAPLSKWFSSDNPVVQQRIHNRRGVTVQASPGLTIDMSR